MILTVKNRDIWATVNNVNIVNAYRGKIEKNRRWVVVAFR